jgi:hypothetical protein
MAVKKATKKAVSAADPAEAFVREMPALRREDATVWLCRTFGFDPMLFESAMVKGWIVKDPATGLWAGAPVVETGEGDAVPPVPPAAVVPAGEAPAGSGLPPPAPSLPPVPLADVLGLAGPGYVAPAVVPAAAAPLPFEPAPSSDEEILKLFSGGGL